MSNLKYSFVKQETYEGNFVFRCEIESFGLNNVTDKNIVSFYKKLSSMSYFDSGLLPVSGTGLLALRYAGNHTQIVYQHAPDTYFINWGSYEGDSSAKAYNVAQPYRIVIADLINDNFYGARIFYSPYPITHPDAELYHVNLPNINCKGYQGNGVGWVCLYHTTDISSYPFSEKLAHVLERCSGIEAYNDQNMSETDGPRFYASHYNNDSAYSYLWDPKEWENKSQSEGHLWTLDSDLWIPVKVQDIDDQAEHYNDGISLTISMAMMGNYKAYYTDTLIPKPVNAIARFPEKFTNDSVENIFKIAFNSSSVENSFSNVFQTSTEVKAKHVNNPLLKFNSSDEEEEEYITCPKCENSYPDDMEDWIYIDSIGLSVCQSCSENYVYIETEDTYIPIDEALYDAPNDCWYNLNSISPELIIQCPYCSEKYYLDPDFGQTNIVDKNFQVIVTNDSETFIVCPSCIQSVSPNGILKLGDRQLTVNCIKCSFNTCSTHMITEGFDISTVAPFDTAVYPFVFSNSYYYSNEKFYDNAVAAVKEIKPICSNHYNNLHPFSKNLDNVDKTPTCICGNFFSSSEDIHFVPSHQNYFNYSPHPTSKELELMKKIDTFIDLFPDKSQIINNYKNYYLHSEKDPDAQRFYRFSCTHLCTSCYNEYNFDNNNGLDFINFVIDKINSNISIDSFQRLVQINIYYTHSVSESNNIF